MKSLKVLLALILLPITGCSLIEYGIAYTESTDNFIPHPRDARVLYEIGAEELSGVVASQLEYSITRVESIHTKPFSNDIKVYVCGTLDCLERYTTKRYPRGTMIGDKIFLSPRLLTRPGTIKSILTHELSHLHLAQNIGKYKYFWNLPTWFQEGLATYVSEGGGAENVSVSDAFKALKEQDFFIPDDSGSVLFIKNATSYGFSESYEDPARAQHMWYRQSSMFVSYLKENNELNFDKLMAKIISGVTFKSAFEESYKISLEHAWSEFVHQSKT